MIKFNCPVCGKAIQVDDQHAGRRDTCGCGAILLVPHQLSQASLRRRRWFVLGVAGAAVTGLAVAFFPFGRHPSRDLSTPKGAALSFFWAVYIDGDADAAKSAAIGTEADMRFIKAWANDRKSDRMVRDAAIAKFGKTAVAEFGALSQHVLKGASDLEKGQVSVDAETATVSSSELFGYRLKRVAGQWKMDCASWTFKQSVVPKRAFSVGNSTAITA